MNRTGITRTVLSLGSAAAGSLVLINTAVAHEDETGLGLEEIDGFFLGEAVSGGMDRGARARGSRSARW